ncbi:hypothetical protein EVAR_25666_1 [Eumeta japonica]|uniref:Uncharacterized protein n=1 Tax=Eumeta variegata TaxID=151549 RepID=A0A4C1WG29_EUMVA|nr:hypothetical protein EVAR_25666_1 [Eumeta japonica]
MKSPRFSPSAHRAITSAVRARWACSLFTAAYRTPDLFVLTLVAGYVYPKSSRDSRKMSTARDYLSSVHDSARTWRRGDARAALIALVSVGRCGSGQGSTCHVFQ